MKIFITIIFVTLLFISCQSTPVPEEILEIESIESIYTVIDHKYSQLGTPIPDWTYRPLAELERDENFINSYLYRFERMGADLDGIRLFTDNFDASSSISRELSSRIRLSFEGSQAGDTESTNLYFENIISTISDTSISGFRKYDDFWIYRTNNRTEEDEYVYYTLFTIEKSIVDSFLQETIRNIPTQTAEEANIQERLATIIESGL